MKLAQLLADSVGLSLVHFDAASGLACFWSGRDVFLEYRFDGDEVEHGGAWSAPLGRRPGCVEEAVGLARERYGLSDGRGVRARPKAT